MPPDPDLLAAELAGIRERAAQITGDHDVAVCIADLGGPCSGHDAERLADAVEAVLATASEAEHGAIGGGSEWAGQIREAAVSKLLSEGDGHA